MSKKPKIAAICNVFFPGSHADVLLMKFLKGIPTDDAFHEPRVQIASIYLDQIHGHDSKLRDVGVAAANANKVPIFPSIRQALTLDGKELAVDGVLLIGEHGDYSENEFEQTMYPRKCFFEQICAVFGQTGRSVPVFIDKGLSYNRVDSCWIYDRARELDIPMMAGSSTCVTYRNPFFDLARDSNLEEALVVGWAGMEIYGFHTLECLQCMVERRTGGEVGVKAIDVIEGDDIWAAGDAGRWNTDLFQRGLDCIENKPPGHPKDDHERCPRPIFVDIEYRDGFKAQMIMLNRFIEDFAFSGRVDGKTRAFEIYIKPDYPHPSFNYLCLNIEEMFLTGQPQYPVERTLFTSCMLDAIMHARKRGPSRIELPELDIPYQSYESLKWFPTNPRPTGANMEPWIWQW